MFKKILFASTCIMLSSYGVYAQAAPYVGAGLGIVTNTSTNNNFRGVPFNLFAGYGAVLNDNFYIAGEVLGTVGTAEISNHGLKSSVGYSVSILPGIMLSDHTLTFLRAGVAGARFSSKTTKTGGQLGLGVQTSLTQNIDLRGEYDFTAYGKFKYKGETNEPRTDTFNLGLIYKFD